MRITGKLFATLRSYAPPEAQGRAFEEEIAPETTVSDMLRRWRIPEEARLVIFVNSVHAERGQILNDGDTLAVFPPIGGG